MKIRVLVKGRVAEIYVKYVPEDCVKTSNEAWNAQANEKQGEQGAYCWITDEAAERELAAALRVKISATEIEYAEMPLFIYEAAHSDKRLPMQSTGRLLKRVPAGTPCLFE